MADIATNLTEMSHITGSFTPNVSHLMIKQLILRPYSLFFFQTKVDYLKMQIKYFLKRKCMHFVE